MKIVAISHVPSGNLIGDRVEVADTSLTRLFGLVPRSSLHAGEGLWIRPSSGIHTFGMRFAIDVLGLDADLRIVRLWRRIEPWRVSAIDLRVKSVIELPAGHAEQLNLSINDLLQVFV